ncbi:NADP-dependent 3-hydroxy acid dehydrogenase YdfG [Bradyrhizobium sp. GM2.4]
MAQELAEKVAAITGAASGIGLECARTLIGAGARVVLIDRAEEALSSACVALGDQAIPLRIDLTDPLSMEEMMPQVLEKAGQLDIFHANAGAYVGGEVLGGDPDAWDRMLNLNVNALFRSIHAVLPHMVERKSGDTSSSPVRSQVSCLSSGNRSIPRPSTPCRLLCILCAGRSRNTVCASAPLRPVQS